MPELHKNKTYNKQEVKLNPITRIMTYFNSIYEILSTQRHMKKLNKKFIKVNEKFYSRINTKQNILDVLDLYKEIEDDLKYLGQDCEIDAIAFSYLMMKKLYEADMSVPSVIKDKVLERANEIAKKMKLEL